MTRNKTILILIIGIVVFVLLRIPSLFEPHWYGDEGVFASVAQEMENGEILYRDVWDNRPHPIYILYMIAGNSHRLIAMKTMSLIAGIITIIGVYFLGKEVTNKRAALAGFILSILLLGLPLFEANIANSENFFIMLHVWGFYLCWKYPKRVFLQLFAGIILGIGTIFKLNAALDFFAIWLFMFIITMKPFTTKFNIGELKKLLPLGIGFLLPTIALVGYQLIIGNFGNFIQSIVFDMISYVGFEDVESLGPFFLENTLRNKFILFVIALIVLITNYQKKVLTKAQLFIGLVFVSEFMGTMLSNRHYIHYLLQLTPGFALLASVVTQTWFEKKKFIEKVNIVLIGIIVLFLIITIFNRGKEITITSGWRYHEERLSFQVMKYYETFINYKILGKIDRASYNDYFNNEEPVLDQLGESLKSQFGTENIFLYTDKSWAYDYLDLRSPSLFIVNYHRLLRENGNEQIISDLNKTLPEVIAIEKGKDTFESLDAFLSQSYSLQYEDDFFYYYALFNVIADS